MYVSPDRALIANVIPSGKEKGNEKAESTVRVQSAEGKQSFTYDFSSDDGEHGYGVNSAQWTADSNFFVLTMSSSGGHSPMFAPVVFWSKTDNTFYSLPQYTASYVFELRGDSIRLSTWPGMQPATVALRDLKPDEAVPVKPQK